MNTNRPAFELPVASEAFGPDSAWQEHAAFTSPHHNMQQFMSHGTADSTTDRDENEQGISPRDNSSMPWQGTSKTQQACTDAELLYQAQAFQHALASPLHDTQRPSSSFDAQYLAMNKMTEAKEDISSQLPPVLASTDNDMHKTEQLPSDHQQQGFQDYWPHYFHPSSGSRHNLSQNSHVNVSPYSDQAFAAHNNSPEIQPEHAHANNLALGGMLFPITGDVDPLQFVWPEYAAGYAHMPQEMAPGLAAQALPSSPTDSSLEIRSLSSSDNGWASVEYLRGFAGSVASSRRSGAIFNPEETLHGRAFSDSSYSDIGAQIRASWGGRVDMIQDAVASPSTDGPDADLRPDVSDLSEMHQGQSPTSHYRSTATTSPIQIRNKPADDRRKVSPSDRRGQRKSGVRMASKPKSSPGASKESEKRVGRRKGPLRPEQRKQASEIRKMGACLRCKFLKKTCDKQDVCEGCKPSHARLWQVPCTRVEIKDIASFMRDWTADYAMQASLGFSIDNIHAFGAEERTLFITHGYGHLLPVRAREVFVRDTRCFGADWIESADDVNVHFAVDTARLSAGTAGISQSVLSDYLDAHVQHSFEEFVCQYFNGTPFVTEMLLTVHRYYLREQTPVIQKALKFLLAYNMTQHITMLEGMPDEENFLGRINNPTSQFHGKTVAPVMINYQVKVAMASTWRTLQKELLEELQTLYQSIYSKEKLRNWPTIFMLASVLLAVWEEMQFDSAYRLADAHAVRKFARDMESMPVKVIVGLFTAISQKLPTFQEWDTAKHHTSLDSNPAICDALTEVRRHVTVHDDYLRTRPDCAFDPDDFDSLSSKFMSKLVIRSAAAA